MWKCHFLGPVILLGPTGRGGTAFTAESLQQVDLRDPLYGGWRIIVEDLFVPCEILYLQQLPLLAGYQGRLAVLRTFC